MFDIVVVSCVVRKGEFPSMTDCARYCIACTTLCCFMLQCSLHCMFVASCVVSKCKFPSFKMNGRQIMGNGKIQLCIAPKVFLFNDDYIHKRLSLSLSSGSIMEGPEASVMDSFVHQVSMHCSLCVCP